MSTLVRVVAPTVEPVTLAQAKAQLRSLAMDEDTLITSLISAARGYCENYTGRRFINQTWEARYDYAWPTVLSHSIVSQVPRIILPNPPAQSVVSVKYYDTAGVQQTLSPSLYSFSAGDIFGFIEPSYGQNWPSVKSQLETIAVQYVCGYGVDGTALEPAITQAILMLLSHFNENREAVLADNRAAAIELPFGVKALLAPFMTEGW